MRDFGLENYNFAIFLMDSYISPPPPEHQAKNANQTIFQRLFGVIMHLIMQTKPDIAYAIIILSKHINNPDNTHWQALK